MGSILALNAVNTIVDTPEIIYTAVNGAPKTIKTFTAANVGEVSGSYKAYIGTTGTNPIKPYQVIVWEEIDIGAGIVGHTIPASSSLYVESSVLTIRFTVTAE